MPQVFLKHGSSRIHQFPDYAAAAAFYCAKRDASGKGYSEFPPALLFDASGTLRGHVSYNGRVWAGLPQTWKAGQAPIYG